MGKKTIVSVTYENVRISIKKLTLYYIKCVAVSPVWSMGRFIAVLGRGFTVNGFLSTIQP